MSLKNIPISYSVLSGDTKCHLFHPPRRHAGLKESRVQCPPKLT